jgi:hypothetical protein
MLLSYIKARALTPEEDKDNLKTYMRMHELLLIVIIGLRV